jgi:hypothetical protein
VMGNWLLHRESGDVRRRGNLLFRRERAENGVIWLLLSQTAASCQNRDPRMPLFFTLVVQQATTTTFVAFSPRRKRRLA